MSNDEAREYFKNCGLSYADIDESKLLLLQALLYAEIEKSHEETGMILNYKKTQFKVDKPSGLRYAFFRVDGEYYKERECVSFNEDGFIGFAGWASSRNVDPIISGFINWCDEIKLRT